MTYDPKILIVDDDHSLCNSLRGFLSNQATEILTAYDGKEALELLRKTEIDLVLLDMIMPEIGGSQVIDYIDSQGLKTSIIVMTGYPSTDSAVQSLRRGVHDYLKKPFDLDELTTTVENVLNKKRLEYEKKQAEQALRDSSEKLKFFAYSVIHDLKSPAVGIYGLAKLLHKQFKDSLGEKGNNYLDHILRASEHVAGLIENINIYIASKESPLTIEEIKVKEILQIIRDEFSTRFTIQQIEWVEPKKIPQIKADRLSILRVFRNFVDNSLKHGGEDLSEISVGYEESEEFHILSVSDNGAGIEGEDYDQIFSMFRRDEGSRGIEGAGLGLTIAKELAERHGGTVWVEPRQDRGTTFHISLAKDL